MEEEFYIDSAGRVVFREQANDHVVDEYRLLHMEGPDYEEMRNELGDEMYTFVTNIHDNPPDALVFLDKSARPAYWFFDSLWNELYPGENHPEVKFINIGTEKSPNNDQILDMIQGPEMFKAHVRANVEKVQKVRDHFRIGKSDRTYLDDKDRILIVDEFSHTKASRYIAEALFEAAFRSRYYDGIESVAIFSNEPPWNTKNKDFNRFGLGVKDKKPGDYSVKPIIPHPHEVNQLKHEMKMLAEETSRRYKIT